jgi:hypothetical protein
MMRSSFVLAAVALSGCAGGWHRANTTEQEFLADRWACERESAQAYPPAMATTGGYQGPAHTNCTAVSYGMVNCTTTPGVTVPGVTSDQNALPRVLALRRCLQSKGYTWKTE